MNMTPTNTMLYYRVIMSDTGIGKGNAKGDISNPSYSTSVVFIIMLNAKENGGQGDTVGYYL